MLSGLSMNETEFRDWSNEHSVPNKIVAALIKSAGLATEDSRVGRAMLDYGGIAEITDDVIIESCPFDAGFVVFGDCPNGDPIAIDVQNNVGTIPYLSHEEPDGCDFPSFRVAESLENFLQQYANEQMPIDYHEALGWDFSQTAG